MTEILQTLPAGGGLYLRAARTARRKPGKKDLQLPSAGVGFEGLNVDARRLAAYRELCGFEANGQLPITLPQVLAGPLHMWLMLQKDFPLPLVGLVHLRNRFEVLGDLPDDGSWSVRVRFGDWRRTHQGIEVELLTEFTDEDAQPVYRSLMTVLHRIKDKSGPRPPKPPPPAPSLARYRAFAAGADIGRRYAKVSGDYNPIHLSAPSARALGFPRAIAHGMWSLARAAALIEQSAGSAARTLEVQFRQPLLLPGRVALRMRDDGDDVAFSLLAQGSDKVHFEGRLST